MSGVARSFGRVVELYELTRPAHSKLALDRVVEATGLTRSAHVVDVGAGTGLLTRMLAQRFEHVVAVEPDDEMRSRIADAESLAGTAEQIPLPDASADAVFAADAFHWFDGPVALREIARVLRPGGWIVVLWNHWWDTDPPIPERAQELLREPFVRSGRAAAAAAGEDELEAFAGLAFGPLEADSVPGEALLSADDLVSLYLTTSSIASLPREERDALEASLRALLCGTYRLPLTHHLHWARKR